MRRWMKCAYFIALPWPDLRFIHLGNKKAAGMSTAAGQGTCRTAGLVVPVVRQNGIVSSENSSAVVRAETG
jgi:hypothetical protein